MNQKRCETGGIRSIASWLDPTPTVPHVNVLAVDKNCTKVFYHNKKSGSWSEYMEHTVGELKCYPPQWNFSRFLRMVSPAQTSLNFILFHLVCVFHLHTLSEMKTSTGCLNFVFAIFSPLTAVKKCEGYLFSSSEISKNRSLWYVLGKILLLKKWLALIILRGTKFTLKVDFADG